MAIWVLGRGVTRGGFGRFSSGKSRVCSSIIVSGISIIVIGHWRKWHGKNREFL